MDFARATISWPFSGDLNVCVLRPLGPRLCHGFDGAWLDAQKPITLILFESASSGVNHLLFVDN